MLRVKTIFTHVSLKAQVSAVASDMGTRAAVRLPKLGRWLTQRRGDRSLESVARRVRELLSEQGVQFPSSALFRHEQGVPPPLVVFYALAVVYRVEPATLFDVVGRDLRLLADSPSEKPESLHSETAEAVAAWFDRLTTDMQRSIVTAHKIPLEPRESSPPQRIRRARG